ncbi:MAG: ECF transporter S component [Oscillospiraceae bacterium]|jgi:uncharacterized membrane protein|nr:ECF transporter S component [Oscillospiraceae bacterium]
MRKKTTLFTVQLALLIAIQIVLTITPLGYIPFVMEITIMHIPVLVGAIVLGPLAGGILGTVFGLSSLFVAITRPAISTWPFNPVMTGSVSSVLIAMVPRILLGILAAYVFRWMLKLKVPQRVAAGIAAAAGSICNTILVLGGVYLLLGERYVAEMGALETQSMDAALTALRVSFLGIISTNGVIEAIAAIIVCVALVKPLRNLGGGL